MHKKIITVIFCTALYVLVLCFLNFAFPVTSMSKRIAQNENVSDAKILDSDFDIFYPKYEIEIRTKNKCKIILRRVKWSLKNEDIRISQINDIQYQGGRAYEITKEGDFFYHPNDIRLLGKMLGIKLKSVNDVIDHCEELYALFELCESNSRREFLYKDRFLINADFRKGVREK